MKKKITVAILGLGSRGGGYADVILKNPDIFRLVAVADPNKDRVNHIKNLHNIPEEMCVDNWEELLSKPKLADVVMICTQDKMHYEPMLKAIEKKYDILLEKPVSPSPRECIEIAKKANEAGVKVVVCHVLRYTKFYKFIKKFIEDGCLGKIMNIMHFEGVGYSHYSHSFVRGNWRNSIESSPMILQKCCHDLDLLQWLIDKPCISVQSYGELSYFNEKNAPKGATQYCMDGCPHKDSCLYAVPDMYSEGRWAYCCRGTIANKYNPTDEEVVNALKKGPYGRCVFKCDNNVVDHQVVNMLFEDNITVTHTMSAFTELGRYSKFMGTKGELTANFDKQIIEFYDFKTEQTQTLISPEKDFDGSIVGGHGGGDTGIIMDLYEYVANNKQSNSISDISVSVQNHLIAFASEKSRLTGEIVNLKEYENSL